MGQAMSRDERLAIFVVLTVSDSRLAVIDALRAHGQMTQDELGSFLVRSQDLTPEAVPNLGRGHLSDLEHVQLIARVNAGNKMPVWREGPALAGGVDWTRIDPADEELTAAAMSFRRAMVERRIHRQRVYAASPNRFPAEWVSAVVGRDNVVRCTVDELAELDVRLAAVLREWDEDVAARREREGGAGEQPCFRTVAAFPWGWGD